MGRQDADSSDLLWPARVHRGPDQAFETSLQTRSHHEPPVFPLDEEGEEEEEKEDKEEEMAGVNWSTGGCTYDRVNRELAQELSEQVRPDLASVLLLTLLNKGPWHPTRGPGS